MGKGIDYITRGPEYENTWQRSGTRKQPPKAVRCCGCGSFVSSEASECPSCGYDLTSEEQRAENERSRRSTRVWIPVLILIGALVCAAALYLLLHTPRMV